MEENTFINVSKDMMSFIEKSPTAFQVTANFMDLLDDAGFVRLNERDRWHLIPGGKYYVTRNDSSIIAFRMPAAEGFINYQIAAAHSDSPSFKVKENPELTPDKNYVSLNVEKYGGMLMAPWFDRPLSVAGRAIVKSRLAGSPADKAFLPLDTRCHGGKPERLPPPCQKYFVSKSCFAFSNKFHFNQYSYLRV